VVAGILLAAMVGVGAYNLGVAQGLAQQAPAGAFGAYGGPWRHPFGFGWFFFPLFFFGWVVLLRALVWGGRGGWRGGRGWARGGPHEVPPAFEEWHRRAHAADRGEPGTPA
jgi:hypothetical protein